MAKTTNFQDIRRFSQSVVAAGGKLPEPLQNLVKAHAILTAPTPLPGPGTARKPTSSTLPSTVR